MPLYSYQQIIRLCYKKFTEGDCTHCTSLVADFPPNMMSALVSGFSGWAPFLGCGARAGGFDAGDDLSGTKETEHSQGASRSNPEIISSIRMILESCRFQF